MLAAEGLLGHQHANSGWGTFDDDNMVGATAFMETLELALELRRAELRRERRAPRLRSLSVHRGRRRRRPPQRPPVGLHRRRRRPHRRRRAARGAVAQGRDQAPTSSSTPRSARPARGETMASAVAVGLDVGTTGVKALAVAADGAVVARAESHYGLSQPQPGWSEQAPEDWWAGSEAAIAALGRHEVAGIGLSGQMHGLVALDERRARAAAGDPLERPAHGGRMRRDRAAGRPRAADLADRQSCADRLHGAQAAVVAHARARDLRAHPPRAAAQGLRAAAPLRRARDRRRRRLGHAALRRRRAPLLRRRARRARVAAQTGCRARSSRPRSPAARPAGVPVAAGAGDCAAAALGVGVERPGPVSLVLGTSGVVFAALPATGPTRRRACTSSATPCRAAGTPWA